MSTSREDDPVHVLQQWLRQAQPQFSPQVPVDQQQRRVEELWQEALRLAGGDIGPALDIAFRAVRLKRRRGESEPEYCARRGGLPSAVFGPPTSVYGGVDKLQHFFGAARVAYRWGARSARGAGRAWESVDQLRKVLGRKPVGYDTGDLYADDLGAEFGRQARLSPSTPLRCFIRDHPPAGRAG